MFGGICVAWVSSPRSAHRGEGRRDGNPEEGGVGGGDRSHRVCVSLLLTSSVVVVGSEIKKNMYKLELSWPSTVQQCAHSAEKNKS